jgi:hypothetical protein
MMRVEESEMSSQGSSSWPAVLQQRKPRVSRTEADWAYILMICELICGVGSVL